MTTATPKSDAIKGALYDLLLRKLPDCLSESGNLSVATLAEKLDMSHEGVYRWLRSDEISKRGRAKLIEISKGLPDPLTEDDLRPFL